MTPRLMLCLTVCTLAPFAAAQSPDLPPDAAAQTLLNAVNAARSQARNCGSQHFAAAPPLRWNAALARAAQQHADDMAQQHYFSHQSRDGRSPMQRVRSQGYAFATLAENISAGDADPAPTLARWLKSPGHCANIMNPDVRETGSGYAAAPQSRYRHYWVQIFGTR